MAGEGEGAGPHGRRTYSSTRRQEQARRTRQRILAAAREQFLASGYAGTSMRAVALAAGVSLPTVELAFGTKSELLKQVIDVAIAGDDEPVPVLERPVVAEALAAGTAAAFLEGVAAVLTEGQQRSARLVVVALEVARADPDLRPLARQRLSDRARTAAWIVNGLIEHAPLRPGVDPADAVDTVWSLMEPVLFCRLTEERGWSPGRYRSWFADSVAGLLLAPEGTGGATGGPAPP